MSGLSKHFIANTRRFKDLIIAFQWVNEEPAMCILRKTDTGRKVAFVICLSSAWQYADDAYLVQQSVRATSVLGSPGDKSLARNFCDAVMNNIDELVKMKPEPKDAEIERLGKPLTPEFVQGSNTIVLH